MQSQLPIAVVGDGLAGTAAVQALLADGRQVLWYAPGAAGSSQAAAGLLNPVSGKFLTLAQPIGPLLQAMRAWRFWPGSWAARHHIQYGSVYRPYRDAQQAKAWGKRLSQSAYQPFLREQSGPFLPIVLHNPLGGLWVRPAAAVNIPELLKAIQADLFQRLKLTHIPQPLDPHQLNPENLEVPVACGCQRVQAVVFAGGWPDHRNPFWTVPMLKPVKGQLLELEAPDLTLPAPVSGPVYVISKGGNRFVLGATFERGISTPEVDTPGRDYLLQRWAELFPQHAQPTVLDQRAGIRTQTPDRKPVVGPHPEHPALWFINGLGSKGLLYAPLLAQELVRGLKAQQACAALKLQPEVALGRFAELRPQ